MISKRKEKTKFPSIKELDNIRDTLSTIPASKLLPKTASVSDKAKYTICQKIVEYKNNNNVTQRELANILGEHESIVSKVVHYNIDEFTIDRLLKFLDHVYNNIEVKIKVA